MKKHFEGVGEVTFEKLTIRKINELTDLIYDTYQKEGIWLTYSKEQIEEELICSFTNINYKPIYYIASFNEKIIGCGSWMWSHTSSNVLELSFGTVHHDYQRKGIGKHLTYLRLKEIIEIGNKDSVVVTVSRRPQFFETLNFKHSFDFKNENEQSYFMYCKVVDLQMYNEISTKTKSMEKAGRSKKGILGIVPKDSTYKNSKIYNDLKAINGIAIDMAKGIIFLSAASIESRDEAQKYLDEHLDLFVYTS